MFTPIPERKEETHMDELVDLLKKEIKREDVSDFFRTVLQILKKTEKGEIYTFISDEVYRGWTTEQLKDEIEKTKGKEDDLLKLKFKVLSSRVHNYVEIEKKHYFVQPLVAWGELPNEYLHELGKTLDSLFSRTIQILVREIDKFVLSQQVITRTTPLDDLLPNLDMDDENLKRLMKRYLTTQKGGAQNGKTS